jgi:acyl-homoserine-lactone acylase
MSRLGLFRILTVPAAFFLALLGGNVRPEAARPPSARVELVRDTYGVPHILAEDWEAGGYGFGWAQAEDHAVEMGRRYLASRGDAARHFGKESVESDFAMRRLDNLTEASRALAQQGPEIRAWLRGFAAAFNDYAKALVERMPSWMPSITEADLLAYGRAGEIAGALRPPPGLVSRGPAASVSPAEGAAPPSLSVAPAADSVSVPDVGSNALAIAGSRTASGKPILLGNPHLRWSSLYWEAHVRVRGRMDFYGSTLVGLPVLRAGFNDRLGYVQTNNAPDLGDVYALRLDPASPDRYFFEGRSHPITTSTVDLAVLQPDGTTAQETRSFGSTPLGPVIHRTADRVYVVRSSGLDAWRYFEGFLDLARSRSRRDFMRSLSRGLMFQSNYTYADADGNVQYIWNARLPKRPVDGTDYARAIEVSDGTRVWKDLHRLADLPQILNPRGGYVQNANNPPEFVSIADRLDMSRYPSYVERGSLALRPQVALLALSARRDRWTPEDVLAFKYEPRSLVADRLVPDLLAAGAAVTSPSADLAEGLRVIEKWDRRVAADSRGAVLFQQAVLDYDRATKKPFAEEFDPARPLETPRGAGDPAALLRALEQAVPWIRATYGSADVAWGDVHRFRFRDVDLPGDGGPGSLLGTYRVMSFDQQPGGVRVAGLVREGQPLAGTGDAWILLVHFTHPVQASSVLAYGQTTDAESPHSRDQIGIFAAHRTRPVAYRDDQIAASTVRRYRPGPAGGRRP